MFWITSASGSGNRWFSTTKLWISALGQTITQYNQGLQHKMRISEIVWGKTAWLLQCLGLIFLYLNLTQTTNQVCYGWLGKSAALSRAIYSSSDSVGSHRQTVSNSILWSNIWPSGVFNSFFVGVTSAASKKLVFFTWPLRKYWLLNDSLQLGGCWFHLLLDYCHAYCNWKWKCTL